MKERIETLYTAFQRKDGAAMAACYHPEATFSDPVFEGLRGAEIGAMWTMLCERGKDLRIEFSATEDTAHWEARYTFSTTGRLVHNVIDARFAFRDGLIAEHVDTFDFWAWSKQALGATGWALGWTPVLRRKVGATARRQLDKYMAR
ncbi:MAG: nuclear transport factor 2 family protein [Myxococcota bacterium]